MSRSRRNALIGLLWAIPLPAACSNEVASPETGGSGSTTSNGGSGSVTCGAEFEQCCTGSSVRACDEVADLTCSDSACVVCANVPAIQAGCTNVAAGAPATADMIERTDRGAAMAVDGSACTYWNAGKQPGDPETGTTQIAWQVDLGSARSFDNLTLWLAMTPAGTVNLDLLYGDDGTTWQTEWSGTREMSGAEPWTYPLAQRTTARYFRIVFHSSPSWAAIRELQLHDCAS